MNILIKWYNSTGNSHSLPFTYWSIIKTLWKCNLLLYLIYTFKLDICLKNAKGICEHACSLISKKKLLVSSFNYQSLHFNSYFFKQVKWKRKTLRPTLYEQWDNFKNREFPWGLNFLTVFLFHQKLTQLNGNSKFYKKLWNILSLNISVQSGALISHLDAQYPKSLRHFNLINYKFWFKQFFKAIFWMILVLKQDHYSFGYCNFNLHIVMEFVGVIQTLDS